MRWSTSSSGIYAPLPRLSLRVVIARLRYGAPQWRAELKPAR